MAVRTKAESLFDDLVLNFDPFVLNGLDSSQTLNPASSRSAVAGDASPELVSTVANTLVIAPPYPGFLPDPDPNDIDPFVLPPDGAGTPPATPTPTIGTPFVRPSDDAASGGGDASGDGPFGSAAPAETFPGAGGEGIFDGESPYVRVFSPAWPAAGEFRTTFPTDAAFAPLWQALIDAGFPADALPQPDDDGDTAAPVRAASVASTTYVSALGYQGNSVSEDMPYGASGDPTVRFVGIPAPTPDPDPTDPDPTDPDPTDPDPTDPDPVDPTPPDPDPVNPGPPDPDPFEPTPPAPDPVNPSPPDPDPITGNQVMFSFEAYTPDWLLA